MKRSHMNFCKECRNAFELKNNIDLCETCRIINDIHCGEYGGLNEENETQPEIVKALMQRYMAFGYE